MKSFIYKKRKKREILLISLKKRIEFHMIFDNDMFMVE
jgi:hypothetical protein